MSVKILDYGARLEAYDRDPSEPGAIWLAEAVRAQPKRGDKWKGWRTGDGSGSRRGLCSTKAQARTDLREMAQAILAERAPGGAA